jgi:acetolactate decarboxylase
MAAKIPNDIYQFSLISALHEGLSHDGPPVKALGGYGTDGIGNFTRHEGELLFLDSTAYHIKPKAEDGSCLVERAKADAQLPFVMVTKFVPQFGLDVNGELEMGSLLDIFGSEGPKAGGKNSFMPFKIRGEFAEVKVAVIGKTGRSPSSSTPSSQSGSAAPEKGQEHQLKDVKGSIFGFVGPAWAEAISVSGMHCYFLSEQGESGKVRGGRVKDFKAKGKVQIAWSVTGRFHMGFPPPSEEWNLLKLGKSRGRKGKLQV